MCKCYAILGGILIPVLPNSFLPDSSFLWHLVPQVELFSLKPLLKLWVLLYKVVVIIIIIIIIIIINIVVIVRIRSNVDNVCVSHTLNWMHHIHSIELNWSIVDAQVELLSQLFLLMNYRWAPMITIIKMIMTTSLVLTAWLFEIIWNCILLRQYVHYQHKIAKVIKLTHVPSCGCMLGCLSHVHLFVTPWMVAQEAPLSMGFFRQEYWSVLPCPPPGELQGPWTEPAPLVSLLAGIFFTANATLEAHMYLGHKVNICT